jgi:hypothetical protein
MSTVHKKNVKTKVPKWARGLVFGCCLYIILALSSTICLRWFVLMANAKFQYGQPIWLDAIYAILITLSLGLKAPFQSLSLVSAHIIGVGVTAIVAMIAFQCTDSKRGAVITIVLFALPVLAMACLGLGMLITG